MPLSDAQRDRAYRKVEKWAKKLDGEFLHDGHALQGLEYIWLPGASKDQCLLKALNIQNQFHCRVVAELDAMHFSGSNTVWLRVWISKEFAPAIKAFYRAGKRP